MPRRVALSVLLLSASAIAELNLSPARVTATCRQATRDAYEHRDAASHDRQSALGGLFTGALGSVYIYCHTTALALLPRPDLSGLNTHTDMLTLPASDTSGSWRAALELHDALGRVTALLQPSSSQVQDGTLNFVFSLPLTSRARSADLLLNRGRGIERAHLK